MSTGISIKIVTMPDTPKAEYRAPSIVEKVQQYIYDINSNIVDSTWEWQYLKRLYNVLSKKTKLNDTEQAVLKLIAPEITKHAEYESEGQADLDGTTMHKHLED